MKLVLASTFLFAVCFAQRNQELQATDSVEFSNVAWSISSDITASFDAFTRTLEAYKSEAPDRILFGFSEESKKPYIVVSIRTKEWGNITDVGTPVWFLPTKIEVIVEGLHQILIQCVGRGHAESASFMDQALKSVTFQLDSGNEWLTFQVSFSYDGRSALFQCSREFRFGQNKISETYISLEPYQTTGFVLPSASTFSGKQDADAVLFRSIISKYCSR